MCPLSTRFWAERSTEKAHQNSTQNERTSGKITTRMLSCFYTFYAFYEKILLKSFN